MRAREAAATAERVEGLLAELERLPEGPPRELAGEAVAALVELYGEGLARVMARLDGAAAAGLCEDELLAHLLMVHDLHPEPLEQRVRGALETVAPFLRSHGGDVELLAVEGAVVRLRLEGSCSGCPSSAVTLRDSVEEAIMRAAPEVEAVEAEGATSEMRPELLQIEPAETLECPAAELGAARGGAA